MRKGKIVLLGMAMLVALVIALVARPAQAQLGHGTFTLYHIASNQAVAWAWAEGDPVTSETWVFHVDWEDLDSGMSSSGVGLAFVYVTDTDHEDLEGFVDWIKNSAESDYDDGGLQAVARIHSITSALIP